MAKNIEIVDKDGFVHERHNVKIDNGKTDIGFVDVPAPKTFEDMATMVENGFDNEATMCKMYIKAKTVDMQAAARRAKTGGKIPEYDFARIYASLSNDEKKQEWQLVKSKVNKIWQEENA